MTMRATQDMLDAVTESMKERTGRTLEEWVALVAASGIDPLDQNAVRRWLKTEHGVKQNSQWAIAEAAARAAPRSDHLVTSNGPGQATHKVVLAAVEDVTDEVAGLARAAYEQS